MEGCDLRPVGATTFSANIGQGSYKIRRHEPTAPRLVWQTPDPEDSTVEAKASGGCVELDIGSRGGLMRRLSSIPERPTVLVVEDSPLIAVDLADTLVAAGTGEVTIAMSVEEARRALALVRFDIVLLDVSLGTDCSDVLLEEVEDAWVVVVSGHLAEALPPAFAKLPFMSKPFQTIDIKTVLSGWANAAANRDSPWAS